MKLSQVKAFTPIYNVLKTNESVTIHEVKSNDKYIWTIIGNDTVNTMIFPNTCICDECYDFYSNCDHENSNITTLISILVNIVDIEVDLSKVNNFILTIKHKHVQNDEIDLIAEQIVKIDYKLLSHIKYFSKQCSYGFDCNTSAIKQFKSFIETGSFDPRLEFNYDEVKKFTDIIEYDKFTELLSKFN